MFIRLHVIWILLLANVQTEAAAVQNSSIDSLQYLIDYGRIDQARAWIDKTLATKRNDNITALTYALQGELEESEGYTAIAADAFRKSLRLSKGRKSFFSTEARSSRGLASTMITLAQYDSAAFYLDQSAARDTARLNLVAVALLRGRLNQSLNEHDKALSHYQKAFDLADEISDNKSKALALSGIGSIYFNQEPDMKRTLEHFRRAIDLCDSAKHFNILARNYGRMGNANMVLGNGREAEKYLLRAKRITDISGNLPVRGYILASLAILKAGDGDIPSAIRFALEPAAIKRKLGLLRPLQNDLLNLGEWYMHEKQFKEARAMFTEGLQTSQTLKDVVYLQYFHQRFARLDSMTGNYVSAYSNLMKAMAFKDSVVEKQRVKTVEELREKYEAEQKEKTIAEKELVIQRQKFQQALIVGGSVVAILLLTGTLIFIRSRHKLNLQKEKEREHQRRLQTIVSTQEEVQQSIARDLHDGLVQVLGAAKVSLESIQGQGDRQVILEKVKTASQIMDEACVEARSISHQLLPYSLLRDGLLAALEELFRKSLTTYRFTHEGDPVKISGDAAINIYRIAQEMVNNIIKHSESTFVQATFAFREKEVVLTVEDNGRGFDQQQYADGVGLMNMRTRAEVIGAKLSIESKPGEGTSVTLIVPL